MLPSYRDPNYAASVRLDQLHERDGEIQEHIPQEIRIVHARRQARTAFGWTAILGFVAVAAAAIWKALSKGGAHRSHAPVSATLVLLATVGVALVVYAIAYGIAYRELDRKVLAKFDESDDPMSRLARLEAGALGATAARIVARSERSSVWLPLAGAAMIAPLSIHLVVYALFKGFANRDDLIDSFDWWIVSSVFLVGLAHVALAIQGFRFAARASQMSTLHLENNEPVSGWGALGWTVFGSLFPGVIAFAIPPIVVFMTGVLFIPYMFGTMHRRLVAERQVLEGA